MKKIFQPLPIELEIKILQFTTFKSRRNGRRLVCKRWLFIIDKEFVRFVIKDFSKQSTIDKCIASKLKFELIKASNLWDSLKFPSTTMSRNPFPQTKTLVIGERNSEKALIYLLRYAIPKVRHLKFCWRTFDSGNCSQHFLKIVQTVNWNSVKKLTIEFLRQVSPASFVGGTSFLKVAKLPNLVNFTLAAKYYGGNRLEVKNLCKELCNFLLRHKQSLTNLNLNFDVMGDVEIVPEYTRKLKSQLNLNTFKFNLSVYDVFPGNELRNIAFACLADQNRLKSFSFVEEDFRHVPTHIVDLSQVFQSNGPNLEFVKLGLKIVNSSWFKNCTSLKNLNFLYIPMIQIQDQFVDKHFQLLHVTQMTLGNHKGFCTDTGPDFAKWILMYCPNLVTMIMKFLVIELSTIRILHEGLGFLHRLELIYSSDDRPVRSKFSQTSLTNHCKKYPELDLKTVPAPLPTTHHIFYQSHFHSTITIKKRV